MGYFHENDIISFLSGLKCAVFTDSSIFFMQTDIFQEIMSKEGASMILKSWLKIVTTYVFRTSKGTVHSFCFRDHPYMRSPQFSNCLTPTLPFLPGIAYGLMTPWGDLAPSSLYPIARVFRSKRRGL